MLQRKVALWFQMHTDAYCERRMQQLLVQAKQAAAAEDAMQREGRWWLIVLGPTHSLTD